MKLSEIDKKLDEALTEQNSQELRSNPEELTPSSLEEILTSIDDKIYKLGLSNGALFKATGKNLEIINKNILLAIEQISDIRKEQKDVVESSIDKESYFDFWLFKIKKTSVIVAVLGLLVFVLTLFCMKQQNDYGRLVGEWNRQDVILKELQM